MSATIWKFEIEITDEQAVTMPVGATILTAQMQREALFLWAAVDPDLDREQRRIAIVGTGNPMGRIGPAFDYIGTVQSAEFVWHIFEILPP